MIVVFLIFIKKRKVIPDRLSKYLFVMLPVLWGCGGSDNTNDNPGSPENDVAAINYSVTAIYPHDTTIFTEGLVFHKEKLFESGGAPEEFPFTRSVIGYYDSTFRTFTPKVEIDRKQYFGEGITFLHNKLYQLTYTNQKGFVYDAGTFRKTGEFSYKNKEGWGLTTDGQYIVMSDGTANLTYLEPQTLQPVKVLEVTKNGAPCDNLNELEFIHGYIYANVWTTNDIVKIDTATGHVVGKMDLTSIVNEVQFRKLNADVLNGIAYNPATDKVYVTGKLWPGIYEIDFMR